MRDSIATADRRQVTIRHALSMTPGLEWHENIPYTDPRNDEIVMTRSKDPVHYVLSRKAISEPGKTWEYNGGMSQVLAAIVQRASGRPIREYARSVLFDPLDIRDVEWVGDLAGMPSAASGLRLRPRDLAKFGSLYLHHGRWRERQVIPADWVRESTRRRLLLPSPVNAFGTFGYAYHWWHTCYRSGWGTLETWVAIGNGQQRIFVLPELGLAVTVLAGRYNDPTASRLPDRLLLEHILPSAGRMSRMPQLAESTACAVVPERK